MLADSVVPRLFPFECFISIGATVELPDLTKPRHEKCQGTCKQTASIRCPGNGVCADVMLQILSLKRLSATDISALASMKNVAKCDTWCELQNPVNHRVFERKLRPKPSGRGHVCLGVTNRRPQSFSDMGRKLASRVLPHAVDQNPS